MEPIRELVLRHFPGGAIEEIRTLRDDAGDGAIGGTRKGIGYGVPLKVTVRDATGDLHRLVFHTERPDEFGHDRRADRVQAVVLAYDTFGRIPGHVRALDAGVVSRDGAIVSIGDGEPFLLTTWADGTIYAEDLRRVAREGVGPRDLRRVDLLADHLAGLHRQEQAPAIYARAVRDLLGAGEGIFGIVDGYPASTPAATASRLRGIEERCLSWRWRLRDRAGRLCRIHGDFHPFNILFDDGDHLATLDASRGCAGDPADDLTALSINYVFFALERPGAWRDGLGALWHRFWKRYLAATGDREVLDVAAPWLAWRALVVACPRWYPDLAADARDRLLGWIERVLDAPRLDPSSADEVAP
jgi:hypothetical protein